MEPTRLACPVLALVLATLVAAASAQDPGPASVLLPAKNYVANGGFEEGIEGWVHFAGHVFGGRVEDEHHSGAACFKAEGLIDGYRYFQQDRIPLVPGKTYTLSAWFKCRGFTRAGADVSALNLVNYGWTKSAGIGPLKPDQDWTFTSVTFEAPPTTDLGTGPVYNLILFWPINCEGTLWVDDVQIEEGPQASAFTDLYLGYGMEARQNLAAVHLQAEEAHRQLTTTCAAYPLAAKLAARAQEVLDAVAELSARLAGYAELTNAQARALRHEAAALGPRVAALRFVRFLHGAYVPLAHVALPEQDPGELRLDLHCLMGETRAVALTVANLTGASAVHRIVPGELRDTVQNRRLTGVPWVRGYSVPPLRGHARPRETFTDPLPHLDAAGLFHIRETGLSQMVLVLDTGQLLPGHYEGRIAVHSLTDPSDKCDVSVDLTVAPVALAAIDDRAVCDIGKAAEHALDSTEAIGQNTFTLPAQWLAPTHAPAGGPVTVDFTRARQLIATVLEQRPDARFLLAFGAGQMLARHLEKAYAIGPEAPDFEDCVRGWAQAVARGFEQLGVEAERVAIETIDEPGVGDLPLACTLSDLIHEAVPALRTMAYVTSFEPDSPPHARLYSSHDITGLAVECANAQSVAYLRALGKQVWVYDCQSNGETFEPTAYYRLLPWRAWALGLDGWGHFSWLSSERGRGYEPWEGVAEQSMVYPALGGGSVVSRRWLALRAGTEDYRALRSLQMLVEQAERQGAQTQAVRDAQDLLEQLPQEALGLLRPGRGYHQSLAEGADPEALDRFRQRLALAAEAVVAEMEVAPGPTGLTVTGEGEASRLALDLARAAKVTVRYLCGGQLPWRTVAAHLSSGAQTLTLPCPEAEEVSSCIVACTDEAGCVSVGHAWPDCAVEVDSTMPPYDGSLLSDGVAVPGMQFEPEHGWVSDGSATEHRVVLSLTAPQSLRTLELWWMTFYGPPTEYKVQVESEGDWIDAPGFSRWRAATSAVERIDLGGVATARVRILQAPGGGNRTFPNLMGLSEVRLR